MPPLLQLNNVEVKYMDVILVLRGVSLKVEPGQVVALLGANGAGKTTTLKAISGLLKAEEGKVTDGSIEFEGGRIENGDPEVIARKGIIQILEGRRVLEHLTVEENLRAGAYIAGNGSRLKNDLERVYNYYPVLKTLYNQTSGYLSGGEQQMLVVARGLMAHPKLMLIDEASLGLAPLLVAEIFRILKRVNEEEKVAMLMVEQNAQAALGLASYGYVIENGRIVLDDTAAKLAQNADIREFYMGLSTVGAAKSYRELKHYKRRKRWLG
ncbi:MAG: ABC transporter ATP-binding protein [Chloroflexi bacterium RBG_13_54_8]|nr:MAG: ABC transporter ATP-binding protein [Chloroflexi bacterium RBG_13_54_8]